jgi:hypothetical protein
MSKVFSAHAVSVEGYITGRDPGAGRADPRHHRLEGAVVTHLHDEVER